MRADMLRHLPRRLARGATIISVVALWVVFVFGCATVRPAPEAEPPEEAAPEEEPADPVLTVPEAYDAISLSVQAGNPEEAIAAYERAQLEDPDDPTTQALLANLYLVAGEVGEANAIIAEVLATDPDNTEALFLQALIRGAEGDEEAQKTILERILQIDGSHARARATLAELQVQDRSYRAAAENFRQALENEPDNLVARVGLGNVYLRRKEYELAEEELSEAIDLAPQYDFAYSDRARARAMQYELGGAERDLTAAIELAPDYYWHHIDRGRVRLERRRLQGAEEDFSRALDLNEELFLAWALRAQARDAQDDFANALADYEAALDRRPDYEPAFAPIGVLYYLTGEYDEAFHFISRAYDTDERRYELALLAALALKTGNREREARDYLNEIVNTAPRDSLAYQMMRYYIQPANEGLVMTAVRDSTDRTRKGQMYFYLGAQLELLGRIQTAQAAFLEAEEILQPGFAEHRLATWRLRAYRSEEEGTSE